MPNKCTVNKCKNNVFGHGYCNMHYKRWKKTGDPGPSGTIRKIMVGCSVKGCPEPHCALGFCNTHWTRYRTSGKHPSTPIRRYGAEKPICIRKFCSFKSSIKGLCDKHYARGKLYNKYQPGFSWDDYDALWDAQEGQCAICKDDLVWDSKLTHVDHSHEEGIIRGLLCNLCNQGLGSFKDSPDLLKAAYNYLR